jgi:hypothetical protein
MTYIRRTLSWQTRWNQVEKLGELETLSNLWCLLFYFQCLHAFFNVLLTFFSNRRVHISEKTLNFLHGEFEVEPAYGEKREEALRIAGLKTYFITKVLKPVRDFSCDDTHSCSTFWMKAGGEWEREAFHLTKQKIPPASDVFLFIHASLKSKKRENCLFFDVCLHWNPFHEFTFDFFLWGYVHEWWWVIS